MDNCKIIFDLLPTYCDDLTSDETNDFIRTHLAACPNCSRQLERMQRNREQQKEADMRRTEFKKALAGYQRRHRIRMLLLSLSVLLLLAVFFLFRAFSFDLAIMTAGLDRSYVEIVQEPTLDNDDQLFQVVFTRTNEGHAALAQLTQNALGFWSITALDTASPDQPYDVADLIWCEFVPGFYDAEPYLTSVFHTVYAGRNAAGFLNQLPEDEIPGNVAVLVKQNFNDYYIHVITVLQDGGSSFDLLPLLKKHNLIS